MTITQRKATVEELVQELQFNVDRNLTVRYRHFVREILDRRTETGVRHQQYSSSKVYMVDGVPHVKQKGKFEAVRGTLTSFKDDDGKVSHFVTDVRLDSDYL